ncbi:hypothetical protein BGZ95_004160 [Linnemannia exigua]|uniref:Yeast cell wall synthesis Kre9/Knh1-like N-terminal domain-containing protein n=1 Tax=Linnemannia exigua TaxID=604196 RepID=A0AAD4H9F2_9FUNG|nr:hypothetical protein BGZ95_004160 [Linnemannia exigua]
MKSIAPIAFIALSALASTFQTNAQLITYSAPISSTQWTAGQPATISWTNSCNQVVGNTTFPVYLHHQVGQYQVQVPGIPELGYLDCKNPGKITIQVPATLPQGNAYSILVVNGGVQSFSALITILSTIPGSTSALPTTTLLPVTTTTTIVPIMTTSVPPPPSTDPSDTGYKLPESGKTKSNGPVIGGAISGVVVVSAIIAFVVIRRRQKSRGSGDSEVFVDSDPVLPSMGDAHKDIAEQDEPLSTNQRELKVATMRGPQIKPASPHSEPTPLQQDPISSPTSIYSSTPGVPHGAVLPSSPQVIVDKNPLAAHLNGGPQNDFGRTSFVVRSPQLVSPELVSAVPASYQELQEQINWMQAELNRRKLIEE